MVSYKKYLILPKMGSGPDPATDIKSFIRNIFHLNPEFAIFCAQVVISHEPNSKQAKYLAERYKIFSKGMNISMPVHPNVKTCTHIKVTGVRCGSPALRGEQFCYFHQRMMRGVRTPPQSRLHPIALIEDEESIQAALMEVINALMRNTIDLKRASLILRALHIAVKNARRVSFSKKFDAVHEVPDYANPSDAETPANGRSAPAPAPADELSIHESFAAPEA